jgi:hypothetical protein
MNSYKASSKKKKKEEKKKKKLKVGKKFKFFGLLFY